MSVNWADVQAKAAEIRAKYPTDRPPVNAFDVANGENIKIVYFNPNENTKNIAGIFSQDDKTIYLNAEDSPERQNFTLAHELAHHFLKHKSNEYGVYWRNAQYRQAKPEAEQEADCFAAELLMPKSLISKMQKELGLREDDILTLAKLFGVTPSAMKFRLKDLRNGRVAN